MRGMRSADNSRNRAVSTAMGCLEIGAGGLIRDQHHLTRWSCAITAAVAEIVHIAQN